MHRLHHLRQRTVLLVPLALRALLPGVVARARHAQLLAHEVHGEEGLLRVNELELHVEPSFAKKAAAFFKKSRSIVSWRFSLRSRTSSSRSPPVNAPPAGFLPSAPSASRTQLRSADSVKSKSLATWGRFLLSSRTNRTASALNSGVK